MGVPSPIAITEHAGVWVLSLRRPPVNAVDLSLVNALGEAVSRAAEESACHALVVTGSPPAFCAGIDVKTVPGYDVATRREMIRTINRSIHLLYGLPKPTIAAINGHALGGGLVLALACDSRLAAEGDYRLGLNEITAGISFPACPMIVVRAELDRRTARDLVLTGRIVEPSEPAAAALIDELIPADRLMETAIARAAAACKLKAYAAVKQQLKAPALTQMRNVVARDSDPILQDWF